MATKTVALTGDEQRVDGLGGYHATVFNNGSSSVYASAHPGVIPHSDGVFEIRSGERARVLNTNGVVYLLGESGFVELTGTTSVFDSSSFSMPGGDDGDGNIDWAKINSVIDSKLVPIEEEQKAQNDEIASLKTDIDNMNNPNLLDNPDFRINQRETIVKDSVYSKTGYFFDRWTSHAKLNFKQTDECIEIYHEGDAGGGIYLRQFSETPLDEESYYTLTICTTNGIQYISSLPNGSRLYFDFCDAVIGPNGVSLIITTDRVCPFKWAKLELGDKATPFIPPHPATELLKCQRYFQSVTNGDTFIPPIYGSATETNKALVPIPTAIPMRVKPAINILGNVVVENSSTYSKVISVSVDRWSNLAVSGFFTTEDNVFTVGDRISIGIRNDANAKIFLSADL